MSRFNFSDPTDAMAGPSYRQPGSVKPSGIVLHFRHLPSNTTAEFKAYINDFGDGFKSQWTEQDVWGRMDDIQTFKNTKRRITISWATPAHSQEEAIDNFNEISKMIQMQYPAYEDLQSNQKVNSFSNAPNAIIDVDQIRQNLLSIENEAGQSLTNVGAIQASLDRIEQSILSSANNTNNLPIPSQQVSLLSSPPIIQMKFMNWVSDSNDSGLYGTISDFNFKPNLEEGVFIKDGNLIPMTCECSVEFTVIHTDKLGWNKNKLRTNTFPYQTNKIEK